MSPRKLPSPEYLSSLLSYDEKTGLLRWRVQRNWRTPIDSVAGRPMRQGYIVIKVDGVAYLAHRIAWAIFYQCEPPKVIDHADGEPANNRIDNLRACTASQNCANARKQTTSGAPFKGVIWNVKDNCWRARITVSGKRRQIGSFKTAEDAHAAYQAAAAAAFGVFARAA